MPPLPPPLAAAFQAGLAGGPKRERTQALLVQAAVQAYSQQGVAAATVQQVAQLAGVTPGTVYNHFPSREALLGRVATALGESLCRVIAESAQAVDDAARRMAIGQRRYVWLAAQSPQWALLLLDVAAVSPELTVSVTEEARRDLRLGIAQGRFQVPSEDAAMDAISGICISAMRRVALRQVAPDHDVAAAAVVLRALGMAPAEAATVAALPLPELPQPPA